MLFTTLLAAILVSLPSALSAPIRDSDDPGYMCGYVLTAPNENVFVSIHRQGGCTGFFYNSTKPGYQDAYAFKLFEGCKCAFYSDLKFCETQGQNGIFHQGPTKGEMWETIPFDDPKPTWQLCL